MTVECSVVYKLTRSSLLITWFKFVILLFVLLLSYVNILIQIWGGFFVVISIVWVFFNLNTVFLYRQNLKLSCLLWNITFVIIMKNKNSSFYAVHFFSVTSTLTNVDAAMHQQFFKNFAYITYFIYQSFAFEWRLTYCTEHLWLSTQFCFLVTYDRYSQQGHTCGQRKRM